MATQTKYPTIVVNDSNLAEGEVDWSGLANIKANDDTDAQCIIQGGGTITGSTSDDPTSASTSGSGADWFDPGAAADGSEYYYADVYAGGGEWSRYLQLRGMSFSIPVTAANGGSNEVYRVKVDAVVSGQGSGKTMEVRLVTSSGSVCNPITKTMPSSKSTLTFEYSNTEWGLPAARSNSTGLGINIRCRTNGTNAGVYFVRVTVYYKSGMTNRNPNAIYATGFEYDLKDNAKINSVRVEWEEYLRNNSGGTSNTPWIPGKEIILLKANDGDHVIKNSEIGVPTGRTVRTMTFTSSDMPDVKRSNIEDPNFGVYLNLDANTSANPGKVYLDFLRLIVDYTDPIYSLSASLSSGKVVGEQLTYVVTLNNTNNCHQGVAIPVSISIPAGLSVASQNGDGSYNTGTGKWNAVLNSQKKATLTLVLNTSASGSKTITASVDGFSTTLSKSTTILAPTYTLSSPSVREIVTETYNVTYTITVGVNTSAVSTVDVNIPIPAGIQYVSSSGNGSYNSGTGVWTAQFVNRQATLTFTIKGITAGVISQVITCGAASFTKTIEVLPANLTVPYHTERDLPEEIINYLEDGEVYTLSCYSVVTDTALGYVYPGEKNFTIAIINGENEYISDKASALNTVTRISTSFIYNKNAPIKLRVYGQWIEINPQNASHEVGGFALYHEEQLIANPNLLTGMGERDNVRTGTDYLQNTTGIVALNDVTIESSTDYATEGERSLKIGMPGATNQEAVQLFRSVNYSIPALAGDERTIIFKYGSVASFRAFINCMNSAGGTTDDILAIQPASPSNVNIGFVTGKILNENTTFQAMRVYNTSTPAANIIYIDDIQVYALNPLENIAHRTDYEPPAALFTDPENLLVDGDYAQVTLSPGKSTAEYRFPNLNWAGFEEDTEIIIKGIEVRGDIILSDEISVNATLQQGDIKANQSSIVPADREDFDVGDTGDKWGLNQIQLSDLTLLLSLTNTSSSISTVQARNIRILIHYIYDQTLGNRGIFLDDVHCREYNIFVIPGWKIPEGTNNELQIFKLARSPGEKITSSTPTSKSFEVPFLIMAEDLEDATEKLQDISEWMTNELDSDDVPITKRLRFEWDPKAREFNAVLDDALDPDFSNVGEYLVKAKFFIPEGIGWGPLRITGATGRNTGRVFVRPVIQISCTGDPQVILWDNVSDQFLTINHQFIEGTVLRVDMENRTILDVDGVDYGEEITLDSYWFRIRGGARYDLTGSTGCVIQRVEFREAL